MALYDGSIIIRTLIDMAGLRRGESDIKSSMERISGVVKKFAGLIGTVFAVGKIVQFGKECIELGSDLAEVQNVVDVTFTTMSEKVDEFAKNAAASAGLSETMAKRYVGTFGAMSKSFGFAEQEAYEMSTALTQLAGDVASFYNISQDESYIKLKSVFSGETETLKDLGVVMTQNALDAYAMANGFGKTTSAMTEQEKVALRYRFVMEQLTDASGDFARTSDSWANQTRILQLRIESLKATIGQGLINLFTPVLKMINVVLGKLATLANAFKAFTQLITGNKSADGGGGIVNSGLGDAASEYDEAASAADDLANSMGDVADATKDAQKAAEGYLSPLDEINKKGNVDNISVPVVEGSTGSVISGSLVDYGSVAQGENAVDKIEEKLSGLIKTISAIKKGFKNAFKADVSQLLKNIKRIKKANEAVWQSKEVQEALERFKTQAAQTLGAVIGSAASVEASFAVGVTGGIAAAKEELVEFNKTKITAILDNLTDGAENIEKFADAIAIIGTAFESEGFQKVVEILYKIVDEVVLTGLDYITGFLSDMFSGFKSVWENADGFRMVLEDIFDIWSILMEPVEVFFDYFFGGSKNYKDTWLHSFFEHLQIIQSLGLGVVLSYIHKGLSLIKELLKGNITLGEAWQLFFDGNRAKEKIEETWNSIKDSVSSKVDAVTGAISTAWESIKTKTSEAWDSVKEKITGVWTEIKDWTTEKIGTIKTEISTIWDNIKSKTNEIWDSVKEKITGIWTTVTTWITTKVDAIEDKISTAWENIKTIFSVSTVKSVFEKVFSAVTSPFSNIATWFKEKFTEAWENVKNVFSAGGEIFSGITDGILSSFKTIVNKLIEGINTVIAVPFDGINTALGKIRDIDIIGAKPFSFLPTITVPKIPYLATGAVIPPNAPFMAMLGDQKYGTNIEAPLDTIKQALKEAATEMGGMGNSGTIIIKQYLDGKQVAEAVVKEGKVRQMSSGKNMFMLGTT